VCRNLDFSSSGAIMSQEIQTLLEPLTAEAPCGVDLEDTQLLASFDTYRLFGSDVRLAADTDWRAIRDKSGEALQQSKDLRLLAHLSAALLHVQGLDAFCESLGVAEAWLRDHWDATFPRVDEDAILRKNALACLADRMAIVDALRRTPFVSHRQLGSFSLRHLELATGQLPPTENDKDVPTQIQIEGAIEGTALEELQARSAAVQAGIAALRNITATMQTKSGFESSPDFAPLMAPLTRIDRILTEHLTHRTGAGEAPVSSDGSASTAGNGADGPVAIGNIQSRQDAIRAIDAIAAYFRKNEPSSPIPLLLDRAKRLVSKSFLEVLEDIAPESLPQARAAGGIKADQN
jgi:type VI secretion system protein ImpA